MIEFDPSEFDKKLFDKCHTNKYSHDRKIYICKRCNRAMKKKKMNMQAQVKGLY